MALSGLRSRWRRDEPWMPPHPTRQGNAWSDNSTTLEPCIAVFRNRPLPRPWVVSGCSAPNCDARIFNEKDALWLVQSASLRTNRMMHQWRLLRRDAVQGRISASFLLFPSSTKYGVRGAMCRIRERTNGWSFTICKG